MAVEHLRVNDGGEGYCFGCQTDEPDAAVWPCAAVASGRAVRRDRDDIEIWVED